MFVSNSWLISLTVSFHMPEPFFDPTLFNTFWKLFMYNGIVYWWKAISYCL